jgi:hypothetical protein
MMGLKFELDIDAEIQKLGLTPAKVANLANRDERVSNFSKISNLPDLKIKNSHISVEEATKLFKKRGWIQIWAEYLNQHIYLVRNDKVKTPDTGILRYAQSELSDLRGLSVDELKIMHEAKKAFGGVILNHKKP